MRQFNQKSIARTEASIIHHNGENVEVFHTPNELPEDIVMGQIAREISEPTYRWPRAQEYPVEWLPSSDAERTIESILETIGCELVEHYIHYIRYFTTTTDGHIKTIAWQRFHQLTPDHLKDQLILQDIGFHTQRDYLTLMQIIRLDFFISGRGEREQSKQYSIEKKFDLSLTERIRWQR